MLTNARLTELRQTLHDCERQILLKKATILERDYVDLYRVFEAKEHPSTADVSAANRHPASKGPHLELLFGK